MPSSGPSRILDAVPASREASPMRVTLNELLALVGRLDDAPGFDTPRERFRRFLFERVTEASALRSLIEQSQHSLGEQHRRALQDAIVMLGRFLGFETTFGTYQRVAGAVKFDGQWRSRHRMEIVLDVRADQASTTSVEELARSLSALLTPSRPDADVHRLGLCIVTPLYAGRARLEDALLAEKAHADIRIVSVRSLLWLADTVNGGHLTHEELLRLLASSGNLDLVVDLMKRLATGEQDDLQPRVPSPIVPVPPPALSEPGYWVVTIEPDEAATPEQFVDAVIRKRRIVGITDAGAPHLRPHPGDWLCFSLRGRGVVGHARVDSTADGPRLLRGAHRFSSVFALRNVEIYEAPIAVRSDAAHERTRERALVDGAGPALASISSEEFAAFTAHAVEGGPEGLRSAG